MRNAAFLIYSGIKSGFYSILTYMITRTIFVFLCSDYSWLLVLYNQNYSGILYLHREYESPSIFAWWK